MVKEYHTTKKELIKLHTQLKSTLVMSEPKVTEVTLPLYKATSEAIDSVASVLKSEFGYDVDHPDITNNTIIDKGISAALQLNNL